MDQGSLLPPEIDDLAKRVVDENAAKGRKVALAESCTGGLVAAAITEIPGSSAVLDRGFVTYSNEAKMESLGVAQDIIETFGAVSIACTHARSPDTSSDVTPARRSAASTSKTVQTSLANCTARCWLTARLVRLLSWFPPKAA